MDDPRIRCPDCAAFDWNRDGFALREGSGGEVIREGPPPEIDVAEPWECAPCGYEVPDRSTLQRRLNAARIAHLL